MKKILLATILLAMVSLSFAVTYNLGMSPLRIELEMYPGDKEEYDLTLVNGTIGLVDYRMEIGSFKLSDNGDYLYPEEITTRSQDEFYAFSAEKWLKFRLDSNIVTVEPLQNTRIKLDVEVPRDVKYGGDYYAMVWANFIPSNTTGTNPNATGTGISIERRFRFGSIIHITIKGRPARSKLELQNVDVVNFDTMATSDKRGLEIDVFVKNSGETAYRPTGDFLITSADNKVWGRGDLILDRTDLVMPQLTRKMYALYDRTLPPGSYKIGVNVKSENRFLFHSEKDFVVVKSTSTAKPLAINVRLSPEEIVSEARAGTTQMEKLSLENLEFTAITATFSAVSLGMDEDGGYIFGTAPLESVRVYPESFRLRESQTRTVPFSNRVARDAEGQEAFAIKVTVAMEGAGGPGSVFYVPVMTRLIGTTKYSFELVKSEKTASPSATDGAYDTLRLYVKNTGNVFTNFNVAYDLIDPNQNYLTPQAQFASKIGFVAFPGITRYVDIPLDVYKLTVPGTYRVPFLLVYKGDENEQKQIKMEASFELTKDDIQKLVERTT